MRLFSLCNTLFSAVFNMWAKRPAVVVFPFVPVTVITFSLQYPDKNERKFFDIFNATTPGREVPALFARCNILFTDFALKRAV